MNKAFAVVLCPLHSVSFREFRDSNLPAFPFEYFEYFVVQSRAFALLYHRDVPHAIENIGKGEATVFLVVIYQ